MRRGLRSGISGLLAVSLVACAPPVPAGYDFITHSLPGGWAMTALLEGSLAVTGPLVTGEVHCVVVVSGSHNATMVAWPERFSMGLAGDGRVEIHGDGQVFRLGDEVRLGGGEIIRPVRHSIERACAADYYFAVQSIP